MRQFAEEGVMGFITVIFTGYHHRRGSARRPQISLLLIKMDTYRHALGQAYPLQIRVNGRHAFAVAAAAAVGYARLDAVNGAAQYRVPPKRGNLRSEARTHAF